MGIIVMTKILTEPCAPNISRNFFDDKVEVKLYNTIIVSYKSGLYTLNSGGHRTRLTKTRINQYSPAHVVQKAGGWLVELPGGWDGATWQPGDLVPFFDGITVDESGMVV